VDRSWEREENRLHGEVQQETDDFEKSEHDGVDEKTAGWMDLEKQRMVKNLEEMELQEAVVGHNSYP